MTATARIRGHRVTYADGWRWDDGTPVDTDPNRPCTECGQPPTSEGHDGCLGTLPGVTAACCGHGNPEDATIRYEEQP